MLLEGFFFHFFHYPVPPNLNVLLCQVFFHAKRHNGWLQIPPVYIIPDGKRKRTLTFCPGTSSGSDVPSLEHHVARVKE